MTAPTGHRQRRLLFEQGRFDRQVPPWDANPSLTMRVMRSRSMASSGMMSRNPRAVIGLTACHLPLSYVVTVGHFITVGVLEYCIVALLFIKENPPFGGFL